MEPSNAASFPANDIDHVRLLTSVTTMGHEPASPDLEKKPPLNENTINAATTDAPPTYDSLYNKLRRAKDESSNLFERIRYGYAIIMILITFWIPLPIGGVMAAIGCVYINDGPINAKISIWLIVTGTILVCADCVLSIAALFNKQ